MPKVNTPMAPIYAINKPYYDVADYGNLPSSGIPDGVASNSAMIIAAANAALANGGGVVFLGEGTWRGKSLPLYANVYYLGAGRNATTIKLEDGANTDLFSANTANINLAGAAGTGSATGVIGAGITDMTLDGNKANQSGGPSYPIRGYGYAFALSHVEVKSGYTGGILWDWNNTSDPPAPARSIVNYWSDVEVHDCNGIGIQVGGPTDQQWRSVNVYRNRSHGMHFAPNCVAPRLTSCHLWETPTGVGAVTILAEAAEIVLIGCQVEGSDTCCLVLLGNDNQAAELELGNNPGGLRTGRGVQLGQPAGQTPIAGQILQSAGLTTASSSAGNILSGKAYNCNAGALDEQNTNYNIYNLFVYQTSGTAVASGSGYIGGTSSGIIMVNGLTADGSPGKGGTYQVVVDSYNGMVLRNSTSGSAIFAIDTHSAGGAGNFSLYHGAPFSGFSDGGATQTYTLNSATGDIISNGWFAAGQSATAPVLASSGTIATANIGVSRVAPAGAVTGVILAAGTQAGQVVTVINESAAANTITFNTTASTSNVADAATEAAIPGLTARTYIWDSSVSRWFRCN